jgi:crotonobetainyl-CoA:carnitine CoA-transferase CaiB-like acyl-CoA transferase
MTMPLDGLLVLDMSQFLSGPYAALRLADLGARVIKIERPDGGDLCRRLYLTDTEIGGDSTLFHAINRGKESFSANLKDPADLAALRQLIGRADVIVQNFRPGVIDRIGLGWEAVHKLNPRVVYASITGWGNEGPWVDLPGQDLLAQSRSGVTWLNGDADDGPVPFGLAVADMLAGATVVQGVLAALVRRGITGLGAHVESSLLEALVDFQFEVLTTYLNDGNRLPTRSGFRSAHAYLAAPYGIYRTADGWLAIAMTPLAKLMALLDLPELAPYAAAPGREFTERDDIKRLIAGHLAQKPTQAWLDVLQPADVWCASVLGWPELLASDGFKMLDMLQTVTRPDNVRIETTRAPVRIDGVRPVTPRAAPRIGEHTAALRVEFGL